MIEHLFALYEVVSVQTACPTTPIMEKFPKIHLLHFRQHTETGMANIDSTYISSHLSLQINNMNQIILYNPYHPVQVSVQYSLIWLTKDSGQQRTDATTSTKIIQFPTGGVLPRRDPRCFSRCGRVCDGDGAFSTTRW